VSLPVQKLRNNQNGYTLLELLVVVIIACILIALIIWH